MAERLREIMEREFGITTDAQLEEAVRAIGDAGLGIFIDERGGDADA